jgi:thermitase
MKTRVLLLAALSTAAAAAPARADEPTPDAVVMQRAPGLDAGERADLRDRADVAAAGRVPGVARVDVVEPVDGDQRRALRALRADPAVRWAEPVQPRTAFADALLPRLWGLANTGQSVWGSTGVAGADIGALAAWQVTRGAGARIAVVDTGAASAHPDLTPQLGGNPGERGGGRDANGIDDDGNGLIDDSHGWDFVDDDNAPEDGNGHGSHVASTAAAAAGAGDAIGVAPEAQLIALQALDADGSGWTSDVAAAFAYAGELGVRVVNASLGADSPSLVERAAIQAHPATLYVVAAGNEAGDAGTTYPCAYDEPNVLCVGASDQRDRPAWFSNFSATAVDLFAPGANVVSSFPAQLPSTWQQSMGGPMGYEIMSGTSMAAPHAAGAAALVAAAHPGWSAVEIKRALMETAQLRPELAGRAVTGGRLDAAAAVTWTPAAEPAAAAERTPAPDPASAPGPATPPVPPAAAPATPPGTTPAISRLRLIGRTRGCAASCRVPASLSFTASSAGTVRLVAERRVGRRYKRAGAASLAVAAGPQRTRLGTRVAGARLRPGTWRLRLGGARITFRVR